MAEVAADFVMGEPLHEARARLAGDFTRLLGRRGYELAEQTEFSLRFDYRYCPAYARLLAVLTVWTLIGLLFLTVRATDQVIAQLAPQDEGATTRVILSGRVSRAVADGLAELNGLRQTGRIQPAGRLVKVPPFLWEGASCT